MEVLLEGLRNHHLIVIAGLVISSTLKNQANSVFGRSCLFLTSQLIVYDVAVIVLWQQKAAKRTIRRPFYSRTRKTHYYMNFVFRSLISYRTTFAHDRQTLKPVSRFVFLFLFW
jgi:hypothetical protein